MNIIIPMAGSGKRFVSAGYKTPKPLIKVGGKRIVEYVCEMYDRENDKFVFVCNNRHLEDTDMESILKGMANHTEIVAMPEHKLGPVYTILGAEDFIADSEPLIVSYCDNPVTWRYDDFKQFIEDNSVDGCIVSHTGFHPHTLSSTMFAYSKTDIRGRVEEIKEKDCYTSNRFKEHASSGVYYFKYGRDVKKYFKKAMHDNINYNGEYYVTLVYNLLIKDGLRVFSYLNDFVLAFGTPNEIENFEAWKVILDGGQVDSVEDAMDCYNYWRRYRNEYGNRT